MYQNENNTNSSLNNCSKQSQQLIATYTMQITAKVKNEQTKTYNEKIVLNWDI